MPTAELPRYGLAVGQELSYERRPSEMLEKKPAEKDDLEGISELRLKWWVWITRKNPDGTFRVLVRKKAERQYTKPGEQPKVDFSNDFLGYCDVASDGSYRPNATIGGHPYFMLHPGELFIRLPADEAALHDGWKYELPTEGESHSFRLAARNEEQGAGNRQGELQFVGTVERAVEAAYKITNSQTVTFDQTRGLVTKIVTDSRSDWESDPWLRRDATELVAVKERDPSWIATLDSEAEKYFAVVERTDKLALERSRVHSVEECNEKYLAALAAIDELRSALMTPELREVADARRKILEDEGQMDLETVRALEEVYSQGPTNWTTTDLDGNPHALADYRGQVVVMDFWYRNCYHCIQALPKIKQLEAKYAGRNVAVLGINNDPKVEDAKYVVNEYDLKYPQLHADKIQSDYKVRIWPTLVVLDQTGRVAAIQQGNSDDLMPYVMSVVDGLLAKPATTPAVAFRWRWVLMLIGVVGVLAVACFLALMRRARTDRIAA